MTVHVDEMTVHVNKMFIEIFQMSINFIEVFINIIKAFINFFKSLMNILKFKVNLELKDNQITLYLLNAIICIITINIYLINDCTQEINSFIKVLRYIDLKFKRCYRSSHSVVRCSEVKCAIKIEHSNKR